jgi:uncharacterized protein YccT (UPF0319 family)
MKNMTNTANRNCRKAALTGNCARYSALIRTTWLAVIMLIALTSCQSQPTYQAYPGSAKPAGEEARVLIPKAFNLLNVDGNSYTQPLLGNGTVVKLLPGSHKIVIKYVDFWAADPDNDEKITSQPMLLAFDAKAGETYNISAPELKDIKAARQYAINPKVDILNSSNQSVATDIQYQIEDKGLIAAFVDSLSSQEPAASPPSSSSNEDAKQTGPALEMLKYWWQKADAQQQEDFMKWVVEK